MACSKPVIASNVGGIPEIVVDGKTGVLIKPKSTEAIAKEVISLLNNKDKIKQMGINGRQIAEQSFSIKRQMNEVERIIDDLLEIGE
jgi:glycosyltransferase involved in cell wall biosynthesis